MIHLVAAGCCLVQRRQAQERWLRLCCAIACHYTFACIFGRLWPISRGKLAELIDLEASLRARQKSFPREQLVSSSGDS